MQKLENRQSLINNQSNNHIFSYTKNQNKLSLQTNSNNFQKLKTFYPQNNQTLDKYKNSAISTSTASFSRSRKINTIQQNQINDYRQSLGNYKKQFQPKLILNSVNYKERKQSMEGNRKKDASNKYDELKLKIQDLSNMNRDKWKQNIKLEKQNNNIENRVEKINIRKQIQQKKKDNLSVLDKQRNKLLKTLKQAMFQTPNVFTTLNTNKKYAPITTNQIIIQNQRKIGLEFQIRKNNFINIFLGKNNNPHHQSYQILKRRSISRSEIFI